MTSKAWFSQGALMLVLLVPAAAPANP